MKQRLLILFFFMIVVVFFNPFFLNGKLPIASDALVGLYYPYRDFLAQEYSRGFPFKNFLITDPFRQQYPWRLLGIDMLKQYQLPLWNPYSMAGIPLLANHQSAVLYPLNILFFFFSFSIAWSILVFSQPLLAGVFLFFYIRSLSIHPWAALTGAIAYAFSGFSIAWLQWNTIGHVTLWLPLILLSIDKIFHYSGLQSTLTKHPPERRLILHNINQKYLWAFILLFSLSSSFFAGHLQIFFYVFILQFVYFFCRWIQYHKDVHAFILFTFTYLLFVIITAIQWAPLLQLITLSARTIDLDWTKDGWFIPLQHLIQFVAPDFFGNPTTLNYWGIWNYGELVGYIGVFPLMMALYAIIHRRDKKTYFFTAAVLSALCFSLPTFLSQLPFLLNIPLLATSQPTRLLFVIDFSLCVLSAFGIDYFLKHKKQYISMAIVFGSIFFILWLFVSFDGFGLALTNKESLLVAKRNLYIPTAIFVFCTFLLLVLRRFSTRLQKVLLVCIFAVTLFDVMRFGYKFLPFTSSVLLFPSTQVIDFLKMNIGNFRVMTLDDRIFPPNINVVYKIPSINGYDPLYLRSYGELIAASERGKPNIQPPFGYNRIIVPKNYSSEVIDLLGVKYVLSLSDITSPKLTKVFQEGETRVYENKNVFPRVFFVSKTISTDSKEDAIESLFKNRTMLKNIAVVTGSQDIDSMHNRRWSIGKARITSYFENTIALETQNEEEGFLVVTDTMYPSWRATIDGIDTNIYRTNFLFRGLVVPKGIHTIRFNNSVL